MMCQRIGWPPISTIGLGRDAVSSASRDPVPPARMTAFNGAPSARGFERHARLEQLDVGVDHQIPEILEPRRRLPPELILRRRRPHPPPPVISLGCPRAPPTPGTWVGGAAGRCVSLPRCRRPTCPRTA